jgi:hypothetical protein
LLSFAVLDVRGESHRHRILAVKKGLKKIGGQGWWAVFTIETPRRRISMDQVGSGRAAVRGEALFRPSSPLSTVLEFINNLWGIGTELE